MRGCLLALVAVLPGFRSETWGTQVPDPATVVFGFERPVTGVSYRFTLREDGSGTYKAMYPATPPATPGETVETPLMLHTATTKKIFDQARLTLPLHGNCETKAKNIAQTGIKTLTFRAGSEVATCSWNYSDKAPVAGLQEEFVGMAATLDTGRRLQMEQKFDRLGLDGEMGFLVEQVKAGQALELENIVPVLQKIAEDGSLLDRVRSRAKMLLQMSVSQR